MIFVYSCFFYSWYCIYKQDAFKSFFESDFKIDNVEKLCNEVISLPIHSEIENSSQDYIIEQVQNYFK